MTTSTSRTHRFRLVAALSAFVCLLTLAWTPARAVTQQEALDAMPTKWADAATSGNVDQLMGLYSPEAFIHVVFTSKELHGYKEIYDYYSFYEKTPPTVKITKLEESGVFGNVGILSGSATVQFPGQTAMTTHFSIVAKWQTDKWVVELQHIARIDNKTAAQP